MRRLYLRRWTMGTTDLSGSSNKRTPTQSALNCPNFCTEIQKLLSDYIPISVGFHADFIETHLNSSIIANLKQKEISVGLWNWNRNFFEILLCNLCNFRSIIESTLNITCPNDTLALYNGGVIKLHHNFSSLLFVRNIFVRVGLVCCVEWLL